MKTSLDLPPELVARAKKCAVDETAATGKRVTLKDLVIRGLLAEVMKAPRPTMAQQLAADKRLLKEYKRLTSPEGGKR